MKNKMEKIGVILAAGMGHRIAKYIDHTQKCMINFQGKPLLHHIVNSFESSNFDKIYIVTGYKAEQIKDYFSKIETNTKIIFSYDSGFEVDSTSRSLLLLKNKLPDEFLYSHSEIFYDKTLIKQLSKSELQNKSAILSISKDVTIAPSHPQITITNNRISDMCLYPLRDKCSGKFSYMGVAKLNNEIFDYLKNEPRISDALHSMIFNKKLIGYNEYQHNWVHFGTLDDLIKFGVNNGLNNG